MEWMNYVISILSGLAITIPLVFKLIEYVKKSIKEKNWDELLDLVMTYMEAAETLFDNGADRKKWVLAAIQASAESIDYDIDLEVVSDLIDDLCKMSKVVNVKTAN